MKIVITNIGKIVSGDIKKGILDADTILVKDGLISKIGIKNEIDEKDADHVVDVNGMVVTPGLIDPHTHMLIGDWSPRQRIFDWMDGAMHGGITTMLNTGSTPMQGWPQDAAGTKAMAILAAKSYKNFKPGGALKVHGGAVVLQEGLTEKDFEEMAREGVWLIAEIGGGGLWKPEDVKDMVSWARKYGYKISVHCGGESIPGSATVTANDVITINPDIVAHTNGGCTAASLDDVKKLVNETDYILEVIYNGNPLMMSQIVELLREKGDLHRLILGSDTPIGIGAIPAAIIRTIVQISSLNKVPADQVIAFATGNTATAYGINTGMIEEGREADLLVMDYNPGSVSDNALKSFEIGDTPGVTMIMIDGRIIAYRGRNTPKGVRAVIVDGQEKKITSHADYLFSSQRV